MEPLFKSNFEINNDEIDKVSETIHHLRDSLATCESDEELNKIQDQILDLLAIKSMLFSANTVYKPEEYVVIDEMRIKKSDYNKFFELLGKVKIDGLDIVKPLREGDFLPGTKNTIRVPRDIKDNESIDDYEDYLYKFYQKNGYVLPPREFVEGTNVYKVREPYIHEKYTIKLTDDGYEIDRQYGSRNPYYRRMKRYYEIQAEKALANKGELSVKNDRKVGPIKISFDLFKGPYVSKFRKSPVKVTLMETIPMDLQFFAKKERTSILGMLVSLGKTGNSDDYGSYRLTSEEKKMEKKMSKDLPKDEPINVPEFFKSLNDAAKNNPTRLLVVKTEPVIVPFAKQNKKSGDVFEKRKVDKSKIGEFIPSVFKKNDDTPNDKVVNVEPDNGLASVARATIDENLQELLIAASVEEKTTVDLVTLENEKNISYSDLIEENNKLIDQIYSEVVEISDGSVVEDGLPRDLLLAFGLNAGIVNGDMEPTHENTEIIVANNGDMASKHPKFASKLDYLSSYVKGVMNRKKQKQDAELAKLEIERNQALSSENNGLLDSFVPFDNSEGGRLF